MEDNIDLRSEKARKLIGDIPNSVVNWGIAITVFFLAVLALVVCLCPYPYSGGETILQHILPG